jgi:hypothetical protein
MKPKNINQTTTKNIFMEITLPTHCLSTKKIFSFFFTVFAALTICLLSGEKTYADFSKPGLSTSVPLYSALLTDNLEERKSKNEFSCMKRIYLYFSWRNIAGTHEITAFWVNPKGKQQNQIKLKFIANQAKVENWVALEFNNLFNERYPLSPDISTTKFVGKWKVRILLDGNLLETKNFYVNCG